MSRARGLLTPLIVTAIGVGTGDITLSLSAFENGQLTSVQASRYLTQLSSKIRSRKSLSSTSYPNPLSHCLLLSTAPPFLTGMSKPKNSTLLLHRPKSRFVRQRRLSRVLRALLGSLRMWTGGPKCRVVNSVSLWIRSGGLMCHSTDAVLQRSHRDIPCG